MDLTALQVVIVDVRALGRKSGNAHRKLVVERALRTKDQDNETFYSSLRARMQRSALHHDLRSEEQLTGPFSRIGLSDMQPIGLTLIFYATSNVLSPFFPPLWCCESQFESCVVPVL